MQKVYIRYSNEHELRLNFIFFNPCMMLENSWANLHEIGVNLNVITLSLISTLIREFMGKSTFWYEDQPEVFQHPNR